MANYNHWQTKENPFEDHSNDDNSSGIKQSSGIMNLALYYNTPKSHNQNLKTTVWIWDLKLQITHGLSLK